LKNYKKKKIIIFFLKKVHFQDANVGGLKLKNEKVNNGEKHQFATKM